MRIKIPAPIKLESGGISEGGAIKIGFELRLKSSHCFNLLNFLRQPVSESRGSDFKRFVPLYSLQPRISKCEQG